ncbi:hypothetical protein F4778DRAFT_394885 [Xylariomycetidae sp. FL2044]|nr:hypothetical protein F4778DRAFT_394885 [Xylariomycetidae sp. FL2044]
MSASSFPEESIFYGYYYGPETDQNIMPAQYYDEETPSESLAPIVYDYNESPTTAVHTSHVQDNDNPDYHPPPPPPPPPPSGELAMAIISSTDDNDAPPAPPAPSAQDCAANTTNHGKRSGSGLSGDRTTKKAKVELQQTQTIDEDGGDEELLEGEASWPVHKPLNTEKQASFGFPAVWAWKRSEFGDALSNFKSRQSGVQTNDGVVLGILLAAGTRDMEVIQSQVIISDIGGGKTEVKGPDGKTTHKRTTDQTGEETRIKTFMATMKQKLPVLVTVSANSEKFPVRVPHNFQVLGYFNITDIWAASDKAGFKRFLVRYERNDLEQTPWDAPRSNPRDGMYSPGQYTCPVRVCNVCQRSSAEVYSLGWSCLHLDCDQFEQFGSIPAGGLLQYNEAFLNKRAHFTPGVHPKIDYDGALIPSLPHKNEAVRKGQHGTEMHFKRGIVCPNCHKCVQRAHWLSWQCGNCGFKHSITMSPISLDLILAETKKVAARNPEPFKIKYIKIDVFKCQIPGFVVHTAFLPDDEDGKGQGIAGAVCILRSKKRTLERPGGVNDHFQRVDKDALDGKMPLLRRPARCHNLHIEELTSHHALNYGVHYKFFVNHDETTKWENAPESIIEAGCRLSDGGKEALKIVNGLIAKSGYTVDEAAMPKEFGGYNEILALGYFEGSRISFHDDGEVDVGPTVATLSLGSPSMMAFELKKSKKTVISFVLQHGDIVIMHGHGIQRLYNHKVDAKGTRRFAFTGRMMKAEKGKEKEAKEETEIFQQRMAACSYKGE